MSILPGLHEGIPSWGLLIDPPCQPASLGS